MMGEARNVLNEAVAAARAGKGFRLRPLPAGGGVWVGVRGRTIVLVRTSDLADKINEPTPGGVSRDGS
jgi:hypothetical protein